MTPEEIKRLRDKVKAVYEADRLPIYTFSKKQAAYILQILNEKINEK